jgi:hypothetical protein
VGAVVAKGNRAEAEARAQLQRLAEEQAALLRLATLVADGVSPREIFSAVSDEVARLFAERPSGDTSGPHPRANSGLRSSSRVATPAATPP